MRLCQFPGFYIYTIKKYLTDVIAFAGLLPAYYRFLCMEKSVHIEYNNNSDGTWSLTGIDVAIWSQAG